MKGKIISVGGLILRLSKAPVASGEVLFYRGHSKKTFTLTPSLHRNDGWKMNEHLLVNELLAANPADFRDDRSMFEKLVRMQHHSLPTRLLDLTSNPLMALYFACCEELKSDGELVIVRARTNRVKYSDSDTASCIANLSRLAIIEKAAIDTTLTKKRFNKSSPILRLHHFIKEEKPYFTDVIVPSDMRSIVCVRPKMSNQRISSQSGAFLLFGLNASLPETGSVDYQIERITISARSKEKICRELAVLNIHQGTVYPNIESSSKVIRARYGV